MKVRETTSFFLIGCEGGLLHRKTFMPSPVNLVKFMTGEVTGPGRGGTTTVVLLKGILSICFLNIIISSHSTDLDLRPCFLQWVVVKTESGLIKVLRTNVCGC